MLLTSLKEFHISFFKGIIESLNRILVFGSVTNMISIISSKIFGYFKIII
jgi:hypothetical protein